MEGNNISASCNNSYTEGIKITASDNWSHAEGSSTLSCPYGHSERYKITTGQYYHAEGYRQQFLDKILSDVEGYLIIAFINSSHEKGYYK